MHYALILAAWSLFGSGPHAEQRFTFTTPAAAIGRSASIAVIS
jgi:hypothetical protein